jgi:hypothetical protein
MSESKLHKIQVRRDGERFTCIPGQTTVHPADRVVWIPVEGAAGPVIAVFSGDTPLVEGPGPFLQGATATVSTKPPLKTGDKFRATLQMNGIMLPTAGDIIIGG